MRKKIQFYLNEVRDQIKSKEAKEFVAAELDYHLIEAKKEWIRKGFNEEEAEAKAVGQMGSPVTTGQQLNKLHRPKIDWLMVILLVTTLGLGFLPLVSLGYMDTGHFSIYKVIFVLLGVAVALGIMYVDYRKLARQGWLYFTIGILILIAIKYFSNDMVYGLPVIQIGLITIESLMAIPFLFLAWASFFNNKSLKIWHCGMLLFLSNYLFFTIPSVSTAYIYTIMVFVMFGWSKFSRKVILKTLGMLVSLFLIAGITLWPFLEIYQKARFLGYNSPESYSNALGLKVKGLMSQAGWFGNPTSKEIITDAHTNFVFASITNHFGWLIAGAVVLVLSLIVVRIVLIANKINDSYGKLLLVGVVALYTVQFISNIGMTLGFFPMTTMSLPFISYGLMPVLLNSILIGLVLSIYRRKDLTSHGFGEAESTLS